MLKYTTIVGYKYIRKYKKGIKKVYFNPWPVFGHWNWSPYVALPFQSLRGVRSARPRMDWNHFTNPRMYHSRIQKNMFDVQCIKLFFLVFIKRVKGKFKIRRVYQRLTVGKLTTPKLVYVHDPNSKYYGSAERGR